MTPGAIADVATVLAATAFHAWRLDADGPAYTVGKLSIGAIRDFPRAGHARIGIGRLYALKFVPDALSPLDGGGGSLYWGNRRPERAQAWKLLSCG